MTGSPLRLIAGRTVSQLGDGIFMVAMLWKATHLMDATWSVAALIIVGNVVGAVATPVGGHLADRWVNRRRTLAVLADLSAFAFFVVVGFAWTHLSRDVAYTTLLIVIGVTSAAMAVLFPSVGALFASLLSDDERDSANSFYQASTSAASLGGLVLGGALIVVTSFRTILWLDAITFGLGAFLTFSTTPPRLDAPVSPASTYAAQWRDMLRYPSVRWLVFASVVLNGALIIVLSLLPFMIVHILKSGPLVLGIFEGVFSAGIMLGAVVNRWWRLATAAKFTGGFALISISIVSIGAIPTVWGVGVAVGAASMAASALSVELMTINQRRISMEHYGKYLATSSFATTVVQPTVAALAGAFGAVIGVPAVLMVGGVLTALGGGAVVQRWARGLGQEHVPVDISRER